MFTFLLFSFLPSSNSGSCWCGNGRSGGRSSSAECRLCVVPVQVSAEAAADPRALVIQAHFPLPALLPVQDLWLCSCAHMVWVLQWLQCPGESQVDSIRGHEASQSHDELKFNILRKHLAYIKLSVSLV